MKACKNVARGLFISYSSLPILQAGYRDLFGMTLANSVITRVFGLLINCRKLISQVNRKNTVPQIVIVSRICFDQSVTYTGCQFELFPFNSCKDCIPKIIWIECRISPVGRHPILKFGIIIYSLT